MKKLSKLFILSIFLSIFISSPVFAATITKPSESPIKGVLVATVNIEDAKIISQKENTFNISFSLSNREGLQPGVKYGVRLIKESTNGQLIADEKIYDESLVLNPNTTIKKEITYTAPSSLSGVYNMILISNNINGFPLGIKNLNKVTITSLSSGIQILPETCSLQIIGGKSSKAFNLNQIVSFNLGEKLNLKCSAVNLSKSEITATPQYETHYISSYGNTVDQSGGDSTSISFKGGEKKIISLDLSQASSPQLYNVNVSFVTKDTKSNSISVNYSILGQSITIDNVSIDKDFYVKGDKALISIVYKSSESSPVTASIKITNGKDKSCAKVESISLPNPSPLKLDIPVSITSSCIDPIVSLSVSNQEGKILAQNDFKVKTTSMVSKKGINLNIIVIILLAILIVYIYMKKKKSLLVSINKNDSSSNSNSSSINIIFPFLLLVALMGFIPAGKASADTFAYASADNIVKGNFNFDKTSYTSGGSMLINGTTTISGIAGVYNENVYGISETIFVGAQNQTYTKGQGVPLGLYMWGAYTFSAPSSSGNATLVVSYSYNNPIGGARVDKSVSFNFAYTVASITYSVSKASGAASILYNTSDIISWSSSNASTCKCTTGTALGPVCKQLNGTDVPNGTSGNFTTPKLTTRTTYVVICS